MVKSLKYRLRPTKKQENILLAHIDQCRILYNQLVCARVQAWKNENKSLSEYDQTNTIPMLKEQHPEFKQVYSQVLQQVSTRVDLAFKAFFRRLKEKSKIGEKAGFPRYKSQGRYDSITYPQFSIGCRLDSKGLRLGSIGCIRIVQHRPLEGLAQSHARRRVSGLYLSLAILANRYRYLAMMITRLLALTWVSIPLL